MPGPHKITLAEAAENGDVRVLFYCAGVFNGFTCWHSGEMVLADAVARWGAHKRLDQIPARCTRCGSREHVDVRADHPTLPPDGKLDALIQQSWRNDTRPRGG